MLYAPMECFYKGPLHSQEWAFLSVAEPFRDSIQAKDEVLNLNFSLWSKLQWACLVKIMFVSLPYPFTFG